VNIQVPEARRDVSGGYKVDVSRGSRVGWVSSEWFSRPDDERFLSLNELAASVRGRSERSRTRVVETVLIHVEANRNDPERLALMRRYTPPIGASANWRVTSAHPLPICASFLHRLPRSIYSTDWARRAPAPAVRPRHCDHA
jgi:hypothetical protein